jgi:PAS domain S-box-containing protein
LSLDVTSGGTLVLPSLILRLEHLAQPEAPRVPDDVPAATDVEAATDAATEAELASTAPATDPSAATQLAEPPAEAAVERVPATIDLAGAERIANTISLSRWSAAVAAAHDGCFVLDVNGAVVSVSVAGVELLGSGDVTIIGRHILEVITLVDLETGAANPEYAPRITPLVALESPGLARSLMRVRHRDAAVITLDTSSAPIHDVAGHLLGSITFVSPIPAR